jgi:hypothetical protein
LACGALSGRSGAFVESRWEAPRRAEIPPQAGACPTWLRRGLDAKLITKSGTFEAASERDLIAT